MTFIDQASKEFNMEPPLCEHADEPFPTCEQHEAMIREKAIRECIAALPQALSWDSPLRYYAQAQDALESLLPKKDRAKELVEEWRASKDYIAWNEFEDQGVAETFANWLISNNLINEKGAL